MKATSQISRITLLAAAAMLVITSVAVPSPVKQPLPALIVTPLTGMAVSGPKGGPFSPTTFQYRLSASTGTIRYSIRTPSWLTVSSAFGVADIDGVTITFTLNPTTFQLLPGTYGPSVAFTNVTNGQGSAARTATLIIQPPSHLPPSSPFSSAGRLLDARGGYLLDDRAGRLLAR